MEHHLFECSAPVDLRVQHLPPKSHYRKHSICTLRTARKKHTYFSMSSGRRVSEWILNPQLIKDKREKRSGTDKNIFNTQASIINLIYLLFHLSRYQSQKHKGYEFCSREKREHPFRVLGLFLVQPIIKEQSNNENQLKEQAQLRAATETVDGKITVTKN